MKRFFLLLLTTLTTSGAIRADAPIDIGSRRELLVDRLLIDSLTGARLELGKPQPAGVAISYDRPWEGRFAFYTSVFRDGDKFRMYYRGQSSVEGFRYANCYAESLSITSIRKTSSSGRPSNSVMSSTPGMHRTAAEPRPERPRRIFATGRRRFE